MALPPICVLAGGLGTRLGQAVAQTPKPLIRVAGEPFLFHLLRLFRSKGAEKVVLAVGYLGEQIELAIGDGARFDLEVSYSYDGPELQGTAGAVRQAMPLLGEHFMVTYGDTYLDIDYEAVVSSYISREASAVMTVLKNDDKWDSSNVVFKNGRVVTYDKSERSPEMRWIDYGLSMNSAAIFQADESIDLADIYSKLAREGALLGYEVRQRFYEIGTPSSLKETELYLSSLR